MRIVILILVLGLAGGCSRDDPRLQGTWRSNRDATVAAAFARDPRWTNASPEKIERFRALFGDMTVSYANGKIISVYRGQTGSFAYRVIDWGSNYVVIRSNGTLDLDRDVHIRFVENDTAYWIDTGPLGNGIEERFDKVTSR